MNGTVTVNALQLTLGVLCWFNAYTLLLKYHVGIDGLLVPVLASLFLIAGSVEPTDPPAVE